jgi:phospholipid transport system transporter-binding protein
VFALPASCTFENATALAQAGAVALQNSATAEVDCAALAEFDSSVISVLLSLKRSAPTAQVHNLPSKAQSLARLYGVETLLQ